MTPPLTVGYLVRRYPELSQTFVRLEVDALRRRGHRVLVASLWRGDDATEQNDPDHLVLSEFDGTRRDQLGAMLRSSVPPWRMAAGARHLRGLRGEIGQGTVAILPRLVDLAGRWRRAGVTHLHAHFAWEGAAAAMVLAPMLSATWSVTVHANDMYGDRHHLDRKLADADRVFTVCSYNRDRLMTHEGVTSRIPIVVCGVEDVSEPGHESLPGDSYVVAVGRLVEKKGFDLLIVAAAEAARRGHPFSVRIIGDGPLRRPLERLVDGLGVGDHVEFDGSLPHHAVLERIRGAALLALPCRIAADDDRDSMPVVAKEAMMRGVPVVATAVGGVPEMIDDEVGALVPANDPSAVAEAIVALLNDPDRLGAAGVAARKRAISKFRLEDAVDVLVDELRAIGPRR